jgi:hypothetical protein
MKRTITLAALTLCLGMPAGQYLPSLASAAQPAGAATIPETITLAKDAKLGTVAFNHANHATKNYGVAGTAPIACVDCHHSAQPASELAKRPPLKTAWPPDRTISLTADLFAADPAGAGVALCVDCHARAGATPKLIPEIPQVASEDGATAVAVTNQLAFHRLCADCHAEVVKTRADAACPTPKQCMKCHTRG